MLLFIFHLVGFVVSAWTLHVHYIHVDLNPKVDRGYGGEWRFLTYVNLNVQFLIFTITTLHDILSMASIYFLSNKVRQFKDFIYTTVAYPLCLFILVTFWVLYAIDRELILPVVMDSIVPYWTNNVFHTYIAITLILSYTDGMKYPSKKKGLLSSSLFMITYIAWISFIFFKTDSWPYPVMNVLPPVQLLLFISFCISLFLSFYLIGNYLNNNSSIERKKKI